MQMIGTHSLLKISPNLIKRGTKPSTRYFVGGMHPGGHFAMCETSV